jgi:hypothetical protein
MTTTTKSHRWGIVLLSASLAAGAFVASACSTSNSNPTPPVYQVSEGGADATTPDAGPDADAQPNEQDGDLQDGELLPDQNAEACTTDAGCWSCIPTTSPEFLNQCTGSQCSPFDNLQRLPDYDGSLPPLQ